jgi:parallel beta-helix repeat protein
LTGDGTVSKPYQKISTASDRALHDPAIDTIQIAAGTYNETVVPQRDGLTYIGERGQSGEWLTIIDPSLPVDSHKWTLTTDTWAVGANVWEARLGYQPGMFIYDGQCIECVGEEPQLIMGTNPATGELQIATFNRNDRLKVLAKGRDSTVKSGGTLLYDVRFWDGPYALAAYDPRSEVPAPGTTWPNLVGSGITYIRFRDNVRPSDIKLLAASISVDKKAHSWTYGIHIAGTSYTTISSLSIQGAYVGIRIAGGHDNLVKNCRIQHGRWRIWIEGDPNSTIVPHDNEISGNTFALNMYGYPSPGAYPVAPANANYDFALKEWFYTFQKYIVGDSNTADIAIKMGYCGANNRIHGNLFENGAEGVFTLLCDNTQIYSNTFQHLSDCGVLASDAPSDDPNDLHGAIPSGETVQGNQFTDVHQFIRYDKIDLALDGVIKNLHHFLQNRGENEDQSGVIVHFYMRWPGEPTDPDSMVRKFVLTMADNAFGQTGAVFDFSGYTWARGGIPSVEISNNTFLSPQTIYWGGKSSELLDFKRTATMVGLFANNRLRGNMGTPTPAWYGPGNVVI